MWINLEGKRCSPSCEFFRCGQKVMERRGKEVYCRFVDDACEGPNCQYAICVRNRLLPNNICSLTVKKTKKTPDIPPEEAIQGVRVKGKLSQRLREEELY